MLLGGGRGKGERESVIDTQQGERDQDTCIDRYMGGGGGARDREAEKDRHT